MRKVFLCFFLLVAFLVLDISLTMAVTKLYQISGFDFAIYSRVYSRFIFSLHFVYIFINLRFQSSFHVELFAHPDVLGNTTNLIEMVLPLLCHLVIVTEAFRRRRKQAKIEKLMTKIRLNLNYDEQPSLWRQPVAKFLLLLIINSLLFIGIIIMVSDITGKCSQHWKLDCSLITLAQFNEECK